MEHRGERVRSELTYCVGSGFLCLGRLDDLFSATVEGRIAHGKCPVRGGCAGMAFQIQRRGQAGEQRGHAGLMVLTSANGLCITMFAEPPRYGNNLCTIENGSYRLDIISLPQSS